ncbi:alpha beta-hydrolase [Boletus reticuloceps]|uniref:Alpha beta-hydrolase n=1 Tax=Boletus reticuloceps TaxID=495285 RepID=A0A8I3AC81_9AGAM|nr:alpha beta-hydrolase [Boletus reticuloceps]
MTRSFSLPLLIALAATAAPTPPVASVTAVSAAQLAALAPYTQFARAAYCSPSIVQDWTLRWYVSCPAGSLPSHPSHWQRLAEPFPDSRSLSPVVTVTPSNTVQTYYVGYWPSSNSVVVAHQGTDPIQLRSDLTDVGIIMKSLDPTLFPGLDSSVQVHSGFANEHTQTAQIILNQVKSLISQYGATSVTLVGHSLGGALAELDCMFMALNLPPDIAIRGVTYGTPRVGNSAWTALFDATISDFQRINNKKDIIPIVPGRFLGFSHVMGEVHIMQPNDAVECPGDDNATDTECTIKSVPNIFDGDILNHLGPYQGIYIGTIYCT